MKRCLKIFLLLLFPFFVTAQQNPDSLYQVLQRATTDSMQYVASRALYNYYEERNRDSAFHYADRAASLAHKNGKPLNEAACLDIKGYQLLHMGRYAASFQSIMDAFKIAEDPANDKEETWILSSHPSPGKSRLLVLSLSEHIFAILMEQTQNMENQILHFKEARTIATQIDNKFRMLLANMNLGSSYLDINKLDSAMQFIREAEQISVETGQIQYRGRIYCIIGEIYLATGDKETARKYIYDGLQWSKKENTISSIIRCNSRLLNYYMTNGEKDSIMHYALENLTLIRSMGAITSFRNNIGTAYESLSMAYKLNNQFDSAFKYQGLALVTKDSLYKVRIQNLSEFQSLSFTEQRRYQEQQLAEKQRKARIGQWRVIVSLGSLILVFLLIMFLQWKNSKQKRKANLLLQQQKEKIESTLVELKATQSQLVQSEKMASLGELTAGIAHEIQNPLNFVNNFSEVNEELLAEMKDELNKGNIDDARAIANDAIENQQKILVHGKRADAIVKGMLQHSRSSSGVKEPTDINALADEYLRLAYHGLRAKDKSFNAMMKTDFDESIGNINIIPQDIGRVILNLITNAFYAVNEKKNQGVNARPDDPRLNDSVGQAVGRGYEPLVIVSTKKIHDNIIISVKDNGNGIPQKVLGKIFQPFFTTKPTGQGTGLGLSLSYDIVKAHGGELKVENHEGNGTTFIILIPAAQ